MDQPVGDRCQVHGYHRPPVLQTEMHHVWPRGLGGPDTPTNRVRVCPSGHANIHTMIHNLCRHGPAAAMPGTRREQQLARSGYDQWVAAGRPGTPE